MNNPLSLNLLSPEQRMDSSLQWHYVIIKNIIFMILIVTFVLAFILFTAKLILLNRLTEAEQQVALVNTSLTGTNQTIADINREITSIGKIQRDFIPWSQTLQQLMTLVPSGITIQNLEITSDSQQIKIDGNAQNRDDLLVFEEALKNADFISDVYLPLANLLQKNDISFTVSLTTKPISLPALPQKTNEETE